MTAKLFSLVDYNTNVDYNTKCYHKASLFPDLISASLLGATDLLFTYHDVIIGKGHASKPEAR